MLSHYTRTRPDSSRSCASRRTICKTSSLWDVLALVCVLCSKMEWYSATRLMPSAGTASKCMSDHCLEWDKWVLTNYDHDRQWFQHTYSTVARVTVDCISRLSGPRYTMPDIQCRDRQYEWDGRIMNNSPYSLFDLLWPTFCDLVLFTSTQFLWTVDHDRFHKLSLPWRRTRQIMLPVDTSCTRLLCSSTAGNDRLSLDCNSMWLWLYQ